MPVFNPPRCLEIAIDKYLALAELQAAGLPVPETRVSQTWEQALEDFQQLGGDVVVKPLFGGEGRGITRVHDEAVAWRMFRAFSQLGMVIYQQRFVPHPGYDLRVLVVGSRLFGIRRRNPLDWRTNVSRGAQAEPLEVDETLQQLSRRAALAVGAPLVGVDILPGLDGQLYVLEVNAVPGWRALSRALQVDVAAEILQWIRAEVISTPDAGRVAEVAPIACLCARIAGCAVSTRVNKQRWGTDPCRATLLPVFRPGDCDKPQSAPSFRRKPLARPAAGAEALIQLGYIED